MRRAFLLILLCGSVATGTPPSISSVLNIYSYTLPGLPNYGIAQGSIFVVFGSNLANTSSGLLPSYPQPLPTNLDSASVAVNVGGSTINVPLYSIAPGQIAAILPSATPIGIGTIAVTNNGQTSTPVPLTVVQSAFGTITLDASGVGPAAAYDVSGRLLSSANPAHPGDLITLWGTGVGPDPGNPNESLYPQIINNLTAIPLEVDVGGIPAPITYRGRSQYPGLDQVNIAIPAGVTPALLSRICG